MSRIVVGVGLTISSVTLVEVGLGGLILGCRIGTRTRVERREKSKMDSQMQS